MPEELRKIFFFFFSDFIATEIFNMVAGNHVLFPTSIYEIENGKYCQEMYKVLSSTPMVENRRHMGVRRFLTAAMLS
jgi:hypothetical protein